MRDLNIEELGQVYGAGGAGRRASAANRNNSRSGGRSNSRSNSGRRRPVRRPRRRPGRNSSNT